MVKRFPEKGGMANRRFAGGFVSEDRKQKVRNQNYWDELQIRPSEHA